MTEKQGKYQGKALTKRQNELLILISRGYTTKGIAEELKISPSTVREHVRLLMLKMGARNRTQALWLAKERGLLATDAEWLMTHINPEGEAVGGEQPEEMNLLHIYSQLHEHCEARIIGNRSGLYELLNALTDALQSTGGEGKTKEEVFAGDGEGYEVVVKVLPDDWHDPVWDKEENRPNYCWRGYRDDVDRIVDRAIDKAIERLRQEKDSL